MDGATSHDLTNFFGVVRELIDAIKDLIGIGVSLRNPLIVIPKLFAKLLVTAFVSCVKHCFS